MRRCSIVAAAVVLPGGRAGAAAFVTEQSRTVGGIVRADDIHPD